ncbi:MAG: DJ-1/PfpI family protein, partial [Bacteroidaceae bacterium]|nr:DJ-1/PfpI family protein [Bacteroidaceae bacterium]
MKKAIVFLAEGFEEVEALTVVDVLRRGGVEVTTMSITEDPYVDGAHGIEVLAD